MNCPECSAELNYDGEIAAPGYGQSWSCPNCKNEFHKVGTTLTNWKNVDHDVFEGAENVF